ncbi:ABC transporter permease [Planctomyces sp. SH-PL62]|uniref:ABC transporter permease n=1 Tax=Planctomyces sp. SH-PL62 TaxID=1636152 RepID=UPI00078B9397|nr:ABC transporter permease [Planctomyces sp. SH-PL62]AMV37063.1 FtsX-like permease family protein [Planctomyces sp. SH-PL62]
MKYLTYIFRNARRNPVRTGLTVASIAISMFLMMILTSFFAALQEANAATKQFNRIIVMNANGFAGQLPIARVRQVEAMDGVVSVTPFSWYGGKYQNQRVLFAQFAVDADKVFDTLDEYDVPPEQLAAFKADKSGAVIGPKLAREYGLKIGDPMPLQGDIYPVDLKLTIQGIYQAPRNTDQRMVLFHFEYLDDQLRQLGSSSGGSTTQPSSAAGNAGILFVKCRDAAATASLCKKIDEEYRSTDFPTRTQTEEAFGQMFSEMMGGLKNVVYWIGTAVVISLLFVSGNAMAMAMRERTTEVAVLKAIGYDKKLVLGIVLAEAVLVSGLGGAVGALGSKALFDFVDISPFTGGFLPFFYVPWSVALTGLGVALFLGFASGVVPAVIAANSSVINGLRKVV